MVHILPQAVHNANEPTFFERMKKIIHRIKNELLYVFPKPHRHMHIASPYSREPIALLCCHLDPVFESEQGIRLKIALIKL